jgi:GNAT superfamily N-acetyltransferase
MSCWVTSYRLQVAGYELQVVGSQVVAVEPIAAARPRFEFSVFNILYSSLNMIQIRQAEAKDVPAISLLYQQPVQPVAPEVKVDLRQDRIEQIRTDPQNFLFVLETNARICRTAFVTLCPDPMHGHQPYVLLEHFVIDESKRGKGYGSVLAQHVEDFCLQAECSKIMLLSNSQRSEAHRFFEKEGFSSELKKGFVKYRSQLCR